MSVWFPITVLSTLGMGACSSAHFSADTPTRGAITPPVVTSPPQAQAQALSLGCLATSGSPPVVTAAAGGDGQATLSGELCPASAGEAKLLFVIDYSGSMGRNRDDSGAVLAGNDPLTNGSCGRLAAAQAVLAAVEAAAGASGSVSAALIPFAGDVLTDLVVPFTPASSFASLVDAAHFCSYVAQTASDISASNPAAIDGGNIDASTNYAAAFEQMQQLVQQAGSAVTAYFISDGEPTSGGADPVAAAVSAGQALLQADPSLTLNGLLLGDDGAKAEAVMQQVVGSADRVRVAAQASQLAQEIVHFPPGGAGLSNASATLTGADGVAHDLALTGFAAGSGGVWSFMTAAFGLATGSQQTVTVHATTATGGVYSGVGVVKM